MKYKPRKGIVMTKICGVRLLVPAMEAMDHCSGILRLSFLSLLVWNTINDGKDIDYAIHILMDLSKKKREEASLLIQNEIDQLVDQGFIVAC